MADMLAFDTPTHRFHLRAAAIIRRNGAVLLHRLEADTFWALPGGRVEAGETAAEAVMRELKEELGIQAQAGSLSLLVENFFPSPAQRYHEVGLYFNVTIAPTALDGNDQQFAGNEGGQEAGIPLVSPLTTGMRGCAPIAASGTSCAGESCVCPSGVP